jgi:hypothetical protein
VENDLKDYTVINGNEDEDEEHNLVSDDNPILDDEPVIDGIREILSLGYSPQDIALAAEWVDENTDWVDE